MASTPTTCLTESGPSAADLPAGSSRSALAGHVVPFVVWMLLMVGLNYVGPAGAWKYALRTALCTALFLAWRPWRWYAPPRWRNVLPALLVGLLVYIVWVFPVVPWGDRYPLLQELYLRFGIMPLGRLPEAELPNIYDPAVCGWGLSLVRLAGSAFTIAVIEEFFWRGFLYRWLIDRQFTRLDLATLDWEAMGLMCLLFGLEHHFWLGGIVAGFAYGWLMIKTRDIWAAALAHVVTNLLLGLYVLHTGGWAYLFW